jgi:hypothetical protein
MASSSCQAELDVTSRRVSDMARNWRGGHRPLQCADDDERMASYVLSFGAYFRLQIILRNAGFSANEGYVNFFTYVAYDI